MDLGTALLPTGRDQPLDHQGTFAKGLDLALIIRALQATGSASIRRRKLPAERASWLMLVMSLLRDQSIQAVCDHLHLVLLDEYGNTTISLAALIQAWDRLGTAPCTPHLEQLGAEIALLVLPASRPRAYPRAVKIKMTHYPRKVCANASSST